jgi:PST family polysaccharide transporter
MLRLKAAALLLGAAGVGLIGLLQNLVTAAAAIGSLGIASAATRQISEAKAQEEEDPAPLAEARRALAWAGVMLAVVSGVAVWLLSKPISVATSGSADLAPTIAWVGLGVAFTVAGLAQVSLLTGFRRIGDVARVTTFSSVAGSALAIASLFILGERGLLPFVLAAPLAAVIIGQWYVMKLPRITARPTRARVVNRLWLLGSFGFMIMLGNFGAQLSQLAIRALIQRELTLDDLGYFQASVALSVTYIGFILGAMGTDYYPRLTAVIGDKQAATRTVNEQTEVALMLGAPLLVIMIGGAPWLLHLLYAEEFKVAAAILRWQVVGDLLKLCAWPLGFVLLAAGRGKTFMLAELAVSAAAVLAVWIGLPLMGVEASGVAFVVCFGCYLVIVYLFARWHIGFRWSPAAKKSIAIAAVTCLSVFALASINELAGAVAAALLAPALLLYAVRRLGESVGGGDILARIRSRFGAR